MAYASVNDALSQYSANLPWAGNRSAALICLGAIQYLLVNRLQEVEDVKTRARYESLLDEKRALEQFLGARAPVASGRSRRVVAVFPAEGGAA